MGRLGEDLHAADDLSRAQILDIESHPVTSRGLRQHLSFGQLAYFLQCPVRYKFAQVYGLELPQSDPMDFGANVHRALLNKHSRTRPNRIDTLFG